MFLLYADLSFSIAFSILHHVLYTEYTYTVCGWYDNKVHFDVDFDSITAFCAHSNL